MSLDKYKGIKRALRFAQETERNVNVSLIRNGEGAKREGLIKKVNEHTFLIRLESGKWATYGISTVEYVEFS